MAINPGGTPHPDLRRPSPPVVRDQLWVIHRVIAVEVREQQTIDVDRRQRGDSQPLARLDGALDDAVPHVEEVRLVVVDHSDPGTRPLEVGDRRTGAEDDDRGVGERRPGSDGPRQPEDGGDDDNRPHGFGAPRPFILPVATGITGRVTIARGRSTR